MSTAAAAACGRRADSGPLQQAAQWLWAQQADDGGFHSNTYGLLRSGQSLTPFILDALLNVPETALPTPSGGVEKALACNIVHWFVSISLNARWRIPN